MKNYISDVMSIAKSKINIQEKGNNIIEFNGWADIHYPRGGKLSWQGQPYCYTCVSFCMITSGLKIPFCASCPEGYNWYKVKGKIFIQPQKGDLAFFNWGASYPQHVSLVDEVNKDNTFWSIEANTSPSSTTGSQANGQGVYRKLRRLSEVLGFGRPNYIQ